MKVGIYTPYLDTLGGGERYMMTIAEILSEKFSVDVFLDSHLQGLDISSLQNKLSSRFELNLRKVNFLKAPLGKDSSFFERIFFLKKYQYFFCLTDGSIFYSTANKSILHFQTPLANQSATGIWGKIKLSSWKKVIFNSYFTKDQTKISWPVDGQVIYPPVDIDKIRPLKKEKVVLNVGRFNSFLKSKKHEEIINTFASLSKLKKMGGWKLCLVGSVEGDPEYLSELKSIAGNLPIEFYPDLRFGDLVKLYGRASIYWHAAGFLETDPTKMEHFGISTVEAMAGGCIPIVINSGGQPEIVEDGKSGFLWNDLSELKDITIRIANDSLLAKKVSKAAQIRSRLFSKTKFKQDILKLVGIKNGQK